ncbi:hypothetical protein RND81_05G090200 [Saponaria officinalis]|uniref:Retrotransposon Copia-like N-terminal domain-containing protein n=1 Tax=Saponaria officinalis TaxID=3572 RepID=A0AAW1KZ98_SAPOF
MSDSEVYSPPTAANSKNLDDHLYISSFDQHCMQLLGYMFTGHNFITWKRDSYHDLISKNKEGFVDGSVKQPDKNDKRYHQWIRYDLMVMKWLLNSIEPRIRDTVQYVSSAKELWSELVERYDQTNSVEIYQLRMELTDISQENAPLIENYSKLMKNWESVDHLDPIPTCTCGAIDLCSCKLLKSVVDRDSNNKLIQFLM